MRDDDEAELLWRLEEAYIRAHIEANHQTILALWDRPSFMMKIWTVRWAKPCSDDQMDLLRDLSMNTEALFQSSKTIKSLPSATNRCSEHLTCRSFFLSQHLSQQQTSPQMPLVYDTRVTEGPVS